MAGHLMLLQRSEGVNSQPPERPSLNRAYQQYQEKASREARLLAKYTKWSTFHTRQFAGLQGKPLIEKLAWDIDLTDARALRVEARAGAGRKLKIFISQPGFLRHNWNMGKRREARERAVQFLFQYDLNPPEKLDEALDHFWNSQRAATLAAEKGEATWGQKNEPQVFSAADELVRMFADPLIRGTLQYRDEADLHIKKNAQNWELHRIAAVDRNILRLAIYEMLHRQDIPPVVSINEAVDIAKKFSTYDSGKFVNGVLNKVKDGLMRPARIIEL